MEEIKITPEKFLRMLDGFERYLSLKTIYFNSASKDAVKHLDAWVKEEKRIKEAIKYYKNNKDKLI